MTSVVIAAHNEAGVIERCLDALLADAEPGELDVTVVANGCSDTTAERAALRDGVRVVVLDLPSKPAALNAGDAVAQGFPRIYLDADVVLTTAGLRDLCEVLTDTPGPDAGRFLAAVPRRELVLDDRPWLVRGYFAINSRLPAFRDGLFGRGVVALSGMGRSRFQEFPALVADDLFLDSLYSSTEKTQVDGVGVHIATPRRTGDLVRRLVRVRRGNSAMRAAATSGQVTADVRAAARWSWLRDVLLPQPWLAPAALCYVAITLLAAVQARLDRKPAMTWERDESSRADPSLDGAWGAGG